MKAAVATDEGDGRPEEHWLDEPGGDVPKADVALRMLPVMIRFDVINTDADQGAAHHAHEVGHDRQQRDEQDTCEEARHDQVVNRVGAETGESVYLLRDPHGGQLSRHRAADAAGEHGGGQHRPQLAHHRHIDD